MKGACARGRAARWCIALAVLLGLCPAQPAVADVLHAGYADVAPRGFTYLVAADAPIQTATLSVYADADAQTDLTPALSLATRARYDAAALAGGFAAIDVRGATPGTTYFARLTVDFGAGPVTFPAQTPLLPVTTAMPLAVPGATLIELNVLTVEAALGMPSLALLTLAGSPHALSDLATVGPHAYDLNNVRDGAGERLSISAGTPVQVSKFLGAGCAARPALALTRRVPASQGGPSLRFEALEACFFADTNCDDLVDVLDLQYLLGFLPSTAGECGFNVDLDADVNGVLDVLDLQALLNRFGDGAPF